MNSDYVNFIKNTNVIKDQLKKKIKSISYFGVNTKIVENGN